MKPEEFNHFWKTVYPDTVPIPHFLRQVYPDRWQRIHSLPESKRYAESPEEWEILLDRQYRVFNDLIGDGSPMLMVSGEYYFKGITDSDPLKVAESVSSIKFVNLPPIDMHKLKPNKYLKGEMYKPMFTEAVWDRAAFEPVLRDVADAELIACFISIEKDCIVAPYDGGMDIIVKDTATRDGYKEKYKDWL